MRRNNNAYNEQVTLFVGTTRIIIVNPTRQIDYATRTIRLTQKTLYTYPTPLSSVSSSKSKSKSSSLSLQQLLKYEFEYKITTNMRPKLLLSKHDPDILAYLKQLKAPTLVLHEDQVCNIVAIAIDDKEAGKYINGFIFTQEEQALQFYEGINQAVASQIYFQLAQAASLHFNYKLSNFLGDTFNGKCVVDPQDYSEQKAEQQVTFIYSVLKTISSQKINNFRDGLFELRLNFKIIDQGSQTYACNYIASVQTKVQKLVLSDCELNSTSFTQIMVVQPFKLSQKLSQLLCLDLSHNKLNDDFFSTAQNLLRNCNKLYNFNLAYNTITLQRESTIVSFLQKVNKYKLSLNLSHNQIKNTPLILKYFINADGIMPVQLLDISNNRFQPEDIASLTSNYLQKMKRNELYKLKLIINQVQFQDARSFQFLKLQHRQALPTALALPLSLSKHPFRKKGKEIGKTQQDMNKFNEIDQLLKKYGTQIFYGNFYHMKQIKDKLIKLGVAQQAIQGDSKNLARHRKIQEQMMIKKMQAVLNFKVKDKDAIKELNESITFARRKGLTGQGVNCLAYIKLKVEQKIAEWQKQNNIGLPYRESVYHNQLKYTNLYQSDGELMQLRAKYPSLIKLSQQDLTKLMKDEDGSDNTANYISYCYLLLQECPVKYQRVILEQCLTDPLLSTVRVLRNSNLKSIYFPETQRVAKVNNFPKKSQIDIISQYGLQSYRFNQTFIQSGLSSSGYNGMLSTCRFQLQHEMTINKFIEIFNNFMKLLYQTPEDISDQTISYIISITEYLMDKQNERQNDLKCTLMEELIIRMMTFFDSQRHRPLKRGMLLSICEFLLRRVEVEEQLLFRLMAHLIKTDSFKQQQMNFHVTASKMPWQGKVDWNVKEPLIAKELIVNRGKIKVSIADISNQKLQVFIEIDELQTVADLWVQVKQQIQKIADYTNINKNQLDFYWLAGTKSHGESWDLQILPSYEHIGKLIFQDKFQRRFFLKRILFPPQYHSTAYQKQLKYEDLLCLFSQVRQNFRESAHIVFTQNLQAVKVRFTVDIMWIETLIEEEIMLGVLRRQQTEESKAKYLDQRQKIINQLMGNIYAKYLPANNTLNEENRNALIAGVRGKVNEPVPKVISETIRENIVTLIHNLGVCSFTTTLTDTNKNYVFYCNNKFFCFQDKSQTPSRKIYVQFKHLLWFEVVERPVTCLKFDIIESISQDQIGRYGFTIHGSSCWLGQIYALIVSICNLRLNFPTNLLCCLEDSKYGVSDSILVSETDGLLNAPPLQLSQLFVFKLPRLRQEKLQQMQNAQGQLPAPAKKQQPANVQNPNENFRQRQNYMQTNPSNSINQLKERQIPIPIPPILQQSVQSSSKRASQQNLQIEQIIKAAGANNQRQNEQQVVTTKRSSARSANSRRKSRNR